MQFFGVVDGVFRNINRHIALREDCLAAQARIGLQPPGAIEQVFFFFFRRIERRKAFSHNNVTRGAGRAHVTGMFDIDFVV